MDRPFDNSPRARLLEVAISHILKSGLTMTNMDDISQEACVSKKTLYKEFHSKERLINCCIELLLQELLNELYTGLKIIDSAEDGW